jgi:hypothetical protein
VLSVIAQAPDGAAGLRNQACQAAERSDLDYLVEETPRAIA